MTITFEGIGDSLGTRFYGAEIRKKIEKSLENGERITVDFEGINIVAHSFADECFGKLLLEFESEKVKTLLSFRNLNPRIKSVLLKALAERQEHLVH